MTQLEAARAGRITPAMEAVARSESRTPDWVRDEVAAGRTVIPANPAHAGLLPVGVGTGLRTKVNANLGTSTDHADPEEELAKAQAAADAGADALMDLSTGGDLAALRARLLTGFSLPLGTVPVYEAALRAGAGGAPGDL